MFYEDIDDLISESQYIRSMFSDKAFQSPRSLCGAGSTCGAIESNFSSILSERSSTTRTNTWRKNSFFASVAHFRNRSDDFRDYFPGTDDKYLIPFHNSFLGKLIVVMERGTTHGYSSDIHGLEDRNWSDHSGSSDGVLDGKELRADMYRRKLIGYGIPGMMFGRSKCVPECEIRELDDESIDFESVIRTFFAECMNFVYDSLYTLGKKKIRRGGESKRFEDCEVLTISENRIRISGFCIPSSFSHFVYRSPIPPCHLLL